jgi:tetratricopeptide (TPR) repeat protein
MSRSRRLLSLLAACASTTTAFAAEPEWIKLQAPGFGVISQLDEEDTRRWAVEFDQFMGALHALYDVQEIALPPLTIVLFKQAKGFGPYRVVTQSGQARVAGFFGRKGDWSVIGMSGAARDTATRRTIYHEAVHWFASASATRPPLWFSEGLAEALSTFRSVDGKGRWGEAIEDNVAYLSYYGLMPIDELLLASQDEALHGNNSYYPQAWAFVHYLMFGNGGTQATKLSEFLRQQQQTTLQTAFTTAFGKSYSDFNIEMRRYLDGGRYGYAEVPLRDRGAEMTIAPASRGNVELALGRLATAGGNQELAMAHAERVIEFAPASPAGYELKAYVTEEAADYAAFEAATERAIALGSRDAFLYEAKADRLVAINQRENSFIDDLLSADIARTAADLYQRALGLRPSSDTPLSGLVVAWLNVETFTETDQITLSASRVLFPTDGRLLVGQAAVEKGRGNVQQASQLLQQASVEPYTLPSEQRRAVAALRANWLGQWVAAQLNTLVSGAQFDEARTLIGEQLADATLPAPLRKMIEGIQRDLPDMERLHEAVEAGESGRRSDAVAMLTDLADNPTTAERTRRVAQRILQEIGERGAPGN